MINEGEAGAPELRLVGEIHAARPGGYEGDALALAVSDDRPWERIVVARYVKPFIDRIDGGGYVNRERKLTFYSHIECDAAADAMVRQPETNPSAKSTSNRARSRESTSIARSTNTSRISAR